jgi:hypothetical protein
MPDSYMINDLGYHPYGKWRPLPILAKCHLKILLGLYHHASHKLQRPIHLNMVSKATFDHYHLCIYDPEVEWLPWYKRGEPNDHPGKPDDEALGEHSDESKLKDAIMMIFNGDHFKWEDNPILESLKCNGITKWSMFVRLAYMDVNNLQIVNRGKIEPIPSWWKELLKTFISLYHDTCHKAKRDLDPEHFSQRMFIDYSICDFQLGWSCRCTMVQ